jgi:hypothetical protein
MPVACTSSHVEVEQLSASRVGSNYPTISEGVGERNKGSTNVLVGSADESRDDQASESHVRVSLTSGATRSTPDSEELNEILVSSLADVVCIQ